MTLILHALRSLAIALHLLAPIAVPAVACRGGWTPNEHGHCPTPMTQRWMP